MNGDENTNVQDLSSEQLDQQISAIASTGASDTPTDAPTAQEPPTGAPPAATGSEAGAAAPAPGSATPPAAAGQTAPAPGQGEKLLAGRFKSADELEKGVGEIGKQVNAPDYLLAPLIEQAKASGDWSKVEATYAKMRDSYNAQLEAGKNTGAGNAAEGSGSASNDDNAIYADLAPEDREALGKYYKVELGQGLLRHPIVKEFEKRNIPFPKTEAQIEALRIEDPPLYMDFRAAAREVDGNVKKTMREYVSAHKGEQGAFDTARSEGLEFIKLANEKYQLGMDQAKMDAILDAALKDPMSLKDNAGIPYPVKDAVKRYFLANNFDDMAARINLQGTHAGQEAHRKTLNDLQQRAVGSASTVTIPGRTGGADRKVTLNDPNQVRGLGDADLDAAINGIAQRPG
jgi:hypothetical protein